MDYDLNISGIKYLKYCQELSAFKISNVDPCKLITELCENENSSVVEN